MPTKAQKDHAAAERAWNEVTALRPTEPTIAELEEMVEGHRSMIEITVALYGVACTKLAAAKAKAQVET